MELFCLRCKKQWFLLTCHNHFPLKLSRYFCKQIQVSSEPDPMYMQYLAWTSSKKATFLSASCRKMLLSSFRVLWGTRNFIHHSHENYSLNADRFLEWVVVHLLLGLFVSSRRCCDLVCCCPRRVWKTNWSVVTSMLFAMFLQCSRRSFHICVILRSGMLGRSFSQMKSRIW